MAGPDESMATLASPWSTIFLSDPVADLIEERVDLSVFREAWTTEVFEADTIWPGNTPGAEWRRWDGAVGTGLDNRVRSLVAIDPLPRTIPDPPPWHPSHICGLPVGSPHALFSCSNATDPALLADLDALTTVALDVLLPPFAEVPLAHRHTRVFTGDLVEAGYVTGQFLPHMPDFVLGDTLIEMRTQRKPNCFEVGRQLAHLVLQDRYDRYGIRKGAVYLARQGVLVRLPVLEFFRNTDDFNDLEILRERYRQARGQLEQTWLVDRRGLEPAEAIVEFYSIVSAQVDLAAGRHGSPTTKRGGWPEPVRTARTALERFPLVDVLDAIRGWRVAVTYGITTWAEPMTNLGELLDPGHVVELSELTRSGPATRATK